MFKRHRKPQLSIYDFITPFGGHLNEENRWVVMANAIDWDYIDEVYEKSFTKDKTVGMWHMIHGSHSELCASRRNSNLLMRRL